MPSYSQEQLVSLADNINRLDLQRKEFVKEIKEAKDEFCKEHQIKKKMLNAALKEYKEWQKNRSDYLEFINEKDALVDVLTGEKCI